MTPVQDQISDALVRKIQLLLNLAARTEGNEAEAAAAMGKAQELLAAYNLDLSTIQDKVVAGGTAAREAESKRDYAVIKRSAMYKWQQRLVRALSEANYCVYWVHETTEKAYIPPSNRKSWRDYDDKGCADIQVKRHRVLGRVANTTAVLIMTDYLMDVIERLLPYPQQERLSRSANSWREGCADRLIQRIQAKTEAMRKADYATQGETIYTTAIQVADMARKEEAANYDHRYGAGAWARKLAADAEYNAKYDDAYWNRIAEENEQKRLAARAAETPAQKAKREREEAAQARRNDRYWDAQERKADREASRRDGAAYRAGQAKGAEIGLDGQLSATTTKELR